MKDRPLKQKHTGGYWRIFPYGNQVNLFDACLATSLDKLFINFKSLQNYAKLF